MNEGPPGSAAIAGQPRLDQHPATSLALGQEATPEELRRAMAELHRLAAALEASNTVLEAQVAERSATLARLDQQLDRKSVV